MKFRSYLSNPSNLGGGDSIRGPLSTAGRRQFIGTVAAAAAAPWIVSSRALGSTQTPPSDRIGVGVIGLGSRGFNLIDALLNEADAQILALCDVDDLHYRDRPWGKGRAYGRRPAKQHVESHYAKRKRSGLADQVRVYADYREMLVRDDIDAVIVATPDHWHALCTLKALQAGKDVYCEKPITHLFAEGQVICREVAARNAVFQTGSQQRSDLLFRRAVELIHNGHIGKVRRFEVGLPPGYSAPQGDTTVKLPPRSLDYDSWTGPAEMLPYMRARHHRWWRGHRAYGGGVLMDWIGHHNDIAHWAVGIDHSGPTAVEAVNWVFPDTDVYDSPFHYEIQCEYPGGVVSSIADRHPLGTTWHGEDGWVFVRRGSLKASDPQWVKDDFDTGPKKEFESPGHMRNFLDCTKSRKSCVAPAEIAHRSITPGHLAYVSQAVGRKLKWDPVAEKVIGDNEAERLLKQVDYRQGWAVNGLG